jgi:hypothetical protein
MQNTTIADRRVPTHHPQIAPALQRRTADMQHVEAGPPETLPPSTRYLQVESFQFTPERYSRRVPKNAE